VLGDEFLQKILVEAVQVFNRVEHGEARAHAEKQRDFAKTGFHVDDNRRAFRQAGELHTAVHGYGRRAGAALRAKECVRDTRRLRAGVRRFAARRRSAHGAMERLFHRARLRLRSVSPREELVRASTHGLEDQIGVRGAGDGKDRQRAARGAEPLDRGHPRRGVGADVNDNEIGRSPFEAAPFDDANRNAARAQQFRDLSFEFFVVADNLRAKLCHETVSSYQLPVVSDERPGRTTYSTRRITRGNAPAGAGSPPLRKPPIGVMRPTTSLPFIRSRKKPM
jgi:hypothetical protein